MHALIRMVIIAHFKQGFFGSNQSKEKKKKKNKRDHFLCANAVSFLAYFFSQPGNFLLIPKKYSFNIRLIFVYYYQKVENVYCDLYQD